MTTFLVGGSILLAGDIPTLTFSIGGADNRTNTDGALGAALGTETGSSLIVKAEVQERAKVRLPFRGDAVRNGEIAV